MATCWAQAGQVLPSAMAELQACLQPEPWCVTTFLSVGMPFGPSGQWPYSHDTLSWHGGQSWACAAATLASGELLKLTGSEIQHASAANDGKTLLQGCHGGGAQRDGADDAGSRSTLTRSGT